jgi:hypothetical protein
MANVRDDKLLDYVRTLDIDGYGIAIHGVRYNEGENQIDICNKICQTGLILGHCYGSINGNAIGVGKLSFDDDKIDKELQNYAWSIPQVNVIIAYPSVIENSKGEKLYLGFTPNPKHGYDQDTMCSFMDVLCSSLGYIPKEFILGYYVDKDNKYGKIYEGEHIDYEFTLSEHFNKIDDNLFEEFKNAMGALSKLSKAYAEKDYATIERFRNSIFGGKLYKTLLDNSDKDILESNEKRI